MSGEPPELRASHADRDRAVDVLRLAAGDGRMVLDTDELTVEFGSLKVRPRDNSGAPVLVRIELVGKVRPIRVVEQFVTPSAGADRVWYRPLLTAISAPR